MSKISRGSPARLTGYAALYGAGRGRGVAAYPRADITHHVISASPITLDQVLGFQQTPSNVDFSHLTEIRPPDS